MNDDLNENCGDKYCCICNPPDPNDIWEEENLYSYLMGLDIDD